jgi:hypothetical protein
MEEDFQDCTSLNSVCTKNEDPPDLNQFLSQIANQILTATDKMSSDFHHVMSDNRIFKQEVMEANDVSKQEVRGELQELRSLIQQYSSQMNTTPNSNGPVPPQVPVSLSTSSANVTTPSINPVSSVNITSNLSSSTDQVLLLLTDLFTKMANALTEKNTDSKAEWPKYSGDSKKFRSWYLAIMMQLSIAPWRDLHDPSKNDVVLSTTNVSSNEKLYSKLILAIEGSALQHVVSRKYLWANGLAALQDLVHTYKPKNIPEVIAAKTSEFWGSMKCSSSETVNAYFNRFQELLDDLAESDEPISTKNAIRQFLFTLGPEFEPIQQNYRINNLPEEWKTQDWSKLLILCRDYYNSVKPTMSDHKSSNSDAYFDKEIHQKKVRGWFMNPTKFCKLIESEQLKHPNKCIYHLSKTHQTENCAVKKSVTVS